MAMTNFEENSLELLSCPVSHEIFCDPVFLEECQHNVEREVLDEIFKKGGKTCPVCRAPCSNFKGLKTNHIITQLVSLFLKAHPEKREEQYFGVARIGELIKKGDKEALDFFRARPDKLNLAVFNHGSTALLWAISCKQISLAESLLEIEGIDLSLRGNLEISVLFQAIHCGTNNSRLVRALVIKLQQQKIPVDMEALIAVEKVGSDEVRATLFDKSILLPAIQAQIQKNEFVSAVRLLKMLYLAPNYLEFVTENVKPFLDGQFDLTLSPTLIKCFTAQASEREAAVNTLRSHDAQRCIVVLQEAEGRLFEILFGIQVPSQKFALDLLNTLFKHAISRQHIGVVLYLINLVTPKQLVESLPLLAADLLRVPVIRQELNEETRKSFLDHWVFEQLSPDDVLTIFSESSTLFLEITPISYQLAACFLSALESAGPNVRDQLFSPSEEKNTVLFLDRCLSAMSHQARVECIIKLAVPYPLLAIAILMNPTCVQFIAASDMMLFHRIVQAHSGHPAFLMFLTQKNEKLYSPCPTFFDYVVSVLPDRSAKELLRIPSIDASVKLNLLPTHKAALIKIIEKHIEWIKTPSRISFFRPDPNDSEKKKHALDAYLLLVKGAGSLQHLAAVIGQMIANPQIAQGETNVMTRSGILDDLNKLLSQIANPELSINSHQLLVSPKH